MYKLTLILKYLRRKLGPMFAALAVMLCTAMVIIVISVMGGFLDMLENSVRQLDGDVSVISRSLTGFAHYEDLQAKLDALPEVEAASPVISTFGMVNIREQTIGVNILGIEPESYAKIARYKDTLRWSAKDMIDRFNLTDAELSTGRSMIDLKAQGMTLKPVGVDMPGMVIGIEVNPWNFRDDKGHYDFRNSAVRDEVTLTVLPLTERGAPAEIGPRYIKAVVVNEFKSGLYEIDKGQVFVRFDVLQKLLGMDRHESKVFDPETGEPLPGVSVRPARTSELVLRGADGYTLEQVESAVRQTVRAFASQHADVVEPVVLSWRQRHAQLINAVKNEKGMVTFLFAIISVVAVVMVATTFYMTVLEKTRDIGVLRAVGASQAGVMGLFLGYGLAVGIVGSLLGLALALGIVWHLNEIQDWLAHSLGVSAHYAWCGAGGLLIGAFIGGTIGYFRMNVLKLGLWFALAGLLIGLTGAWISLDQVEGLAYNLNHTIYFKMWDPQTYYFDRIPDHVKFFDALSIVLGAIVSSVAGALIPAVLAARLNPVEALRYE